MQYRFSKNIENTPKSFIREILKLTQTPEIISFAGGLPNKKYFPVEEMREATNRVLSTGGDALQYSTTEGYLPLRQYISDRYKLRGLDIPVDEILIVSGSQQALDLIAKVFIDTDDSIIIEEPSYLGAIQAFTLFRPQFHAVKLEDDGVDTVALEETINRTKAKIFYTTPNFQNPTGLTYSLEKRIKTTDVLKRTETVFVEDDPYGELRFIGEHLPTLKSFAHDNGILLGSFSKVVAPGLRLGWVCANKIIMDKLVTAKQAADLHTNYFAQRVIHQYLTDNSIDTYIKKISDGYKGQRQAMVEALKKEMPAGIKFTEPEGGMFLWVTLPESCKAMDLFHIATKHKVAFVPGEPFYADGRSSNAMRLNYSCSDEETIRIGVKRLADAIKEYMG
ncbi:MAG: PLP-dependent aminotransferase family protein [Deferribacteraceae bacterium]|jgi:2-aminoadipate transaminase|nr:PLP-dependent aminotransferase family protein [Deferribacteraceae bacterium]